MCSVGETLSGGLVGSRHGPCDLRNMLQFTERAPFLFSLQYHNIRIDTVTIERQKSEQQNSKKASKTSDMFGDKKIICNFLNLLT